MNIKETLKGLVVMVLICMVIIGALWAVTHYGQQYNDRKACERLQAFMDTKVITFVVDDKKISSAAEIKAILGSLEKTQFNGVKAIVDICLPGYSK
jgi:hypothetical protein